MRYVVKLASLAICESRICHNSQREVSVRLKISQHSLKTPELKLVMILASLAMKFLFARLATKFIFVRPVRSDTRYEIS
jgi:hypothetical protein